MHEAVVTLVIPRGYKKITTKTLEKQWIYNAFCFFVQ